MRLDIKAARLQRGWSQQDLARAAGTNQPTVDRIESGQTQHSKYLASILDALGLSGGTPTVKLVGEVRTGFEVAPFSEGRDLDDVEAPPGFTASTVAVRVADNSMMPAYSEGDLIYYDRQDNGDLDHLVGRECVVRTTDGRSFIKRLHRGTSPDTWLLISYAGPPVEVGVEWAARVRWVLKA